MNNNSEFKTADAESYDELVDDFDAFTEDFSHYGVDAILDRVPAKPGQRIVDIGCGTGVVTLAAARKFPQAAAVTGVDLSTGMLSFAREKAAREGFADNVQFVRSDAEALEFRDGSFDCAVSLYAWRHLPDPEAATNEVFRVLRAGGTFVIAVGSGPPLLSVHGLRAVLAAPVRRVAQRRGRELSACDQLDRLVEKYLPRGEQNEVADWTVGHHSFSGSLERLLGSAGFRVTGKNWAGRTYAIDDPQDFWRLQSTFSSIARKRIADASPQDVERLTNAFHNECARVQGRGGRLVYRVGVSVLSAIKP